MTTAPATTAPDELLPNGMPAHLTGHYRALGLWTGDTHWEMVHRTVTACPQAPAATDRHRSITYGQLGDSAERISAVLARAGVRSGQRVVLQLPNSVLYLQTLLALYRLGAVPVFSLPAHGALEVSHFVRISEATHYIGTPSSAPAARRIRETLAAEHPETAVLTADPAAADPWGTAETTGPAPEAASPSAQDLAFLQLSGGTTGIPKLIPRTHDDYLYSVRRSVEICDVRPDDVMLVCLPCSHNFTMSSPGILGALQQGAQIVFAADPSPMTCFPLVQQHRVTQAALVPPMLLSWLNSPLNAGHDLSSLRTLWVGGAKLSQSVAQRVGPTWGCALQQVFGMAEGLVNYTRLEDDQQTVLGTQGRPLSEHDEVRVVDEDGAPVPWGQPGHLQTRGPYTIRQYYRSPENARSFTEDGFYITGDIVEQREDGCLTVVGRAKDQINRGGEKVAPEAVENQILTLDAVHDVSVVGVEDEVLGEKICAYVIPREGREAEIPQRAALAAYLRERGLSSFAVPDVVAVVSEFPQTGFGKVSKKDQR